MRQDRRPGQQAGQPTGLVAEGMKKRIDDQVAVARLQADDPGVLREGLQVLPVGAHDALGLAGGAGREQQIGQIPRPDRQRPLAGSHATDHRAPGKKAGPVQVPGLLWLRRAEQRHMLQAGRAQGRQLGLVINTQELALEQQHPGLATQQNIRGLGAFHAGVDRHQHGPCAMHAQGGNDPVTAVRRPDRHPLARLDAQRHQAAADRQGHGRQVAIIGGNAVFFDRRLAGKTFAAGEQQGRNRRWQWIPGSAGAR
ncbi:hypothetical protein D3C85_698160 [compost metagenome]